MHNTLMMKEPCVMNSSEFVRGFLLSDLFVKLPFPQT